jgi:predicted anti-sigma-YlaC factor YlaD
VARLGLTLVALAQLAISIPALAGADAGASVHIAHEQGSWALALAVGLLVVVWRPTRAHGILPLVTVLVAGLTLTSGLDIVAGRTAAGAEAPHGLAVLGLMLLWWVAHPTMGQRRPQHHPA